MTATPDALVIRIPWNELAARLRPRIKSRSDSAVEEILSFVREGRKAHAKGKTRLIKSLADLR